MENLDVIVLRALADWRAQGLAAILITVVRTWGSSPRPVGSIMALCEDGRVVGSVSGGCIEDDLIKHYLHSDDQRWHGMNGTKRHTYGVSADEAHQFGLPCGGTLEMVAEYNPDAESLTQLLNHLQAGRLIRRKVNLVNGSLALLKCDAPKELSIDDTALEATFGPQYRMLLIGAGQLTEYLATMALFSGFAVTVCDPRSTHRTSWSVKGVDIVSTMPDDTVLAFRPDQRTCIVALTHDPKLDDMALLEALGSDAFYVGAIGSRKNQDARRQRMIEHLEQTSATMDTLRGPVGIYIGSKTPAEIAVSIMAEVIAVKNGVRLPERASVRTAKNKLEFQSLPGRSAG